MFNLQHPHLTYALQTLFDVSCAMFAWWFSCSCSHRCCIWTWKNVLIINFWCVWCPSIALDENKTYNFCMRLQQDSSWKTCLQSQNPTKISSILNLGLNQIISCRWLHALSVKKLGQSSRANIWRLLSKLSLQIHKSNVERLCHTMSCSWP